MDVGPLARRTVLRSGDVDELRAAGTGLFSPHRLRYQGRAARLSASPLGSAQLICLHYGGEARVETTEPLGYYAVHVPITGHSAVSFGREVVRPLPGGGVVFSPGDQPAMGWSSDLCQLAVRVSPSQVRAHASMLAGRPAEGTLTFSHAARPGAQWVAAVRLLTATCDGHAADVLPDALAARLQDLFLTSLLLDQPHTWTDLLLREAQPAVPEAVEHAVSLVEEAPEEAWTLALLSARTGVSGRSLQIGFREKRGCSPMTFVRERRLELAHERLLDPDYAHLGIGDVALGVGIVHLGRFAADHRNRYGVSSSQLRRSLRSGDTTRSEDR
ncbi:AraC family transcriptional regulator [Nocardioides sp. GY 10127]|uniref:AraC family transcriptional regulator n=1 Tax=Nocardioides sp. GY 10127 TaxID=2569762 RepID=UPI0010A77563|nr:AraC family transcriptional regulator [Nocardioides sp. GY 10127]TIC80053.1 AraC family transcriptional regulator [Nocardioides sp. GY 10127]